MDNNLPALANTFFCDCCTQGRMGAFSLSFFVCSVVDLRLSCAASQVSRSGQSQFFPPLSELSKLLQIRIPVFLSHIWVTASVKSFEPKKITCKQFPFLCHLFVKHPVIKALCLVSTSVRVRRPFNQKSIISYENLGDILCSCKTPPLHNILVRIVPGVCSKN